LWSVERIAHFQDEAASRGKNGRTPIKSAESPPTL
jgi:hypothetical protein